MFDAPFKAHYKMQDLKKMKVIITGKSKLPPCIIIIFFNNYVVTELAITSDEKGEEIIDIIQCGESQIMDQPIELF